VFIVGLKAGLRSGKVIIFLFASGTGVKHSTPAEHLSTIKKFAPAGLQSSVEMIYDSG